MEEAITSDTVRDLLAQREAVVKYGQFALQSGDLPLILHEACRLTARAMGTELAKILELQEDGQSLLVVAGVGWKAGVVGEERVPAIAQSSEGYALRTGAPAVSEDINEEDRFDYADFLKRHGVKAIINVVIPGPEGRPPYGLLQVDSREERDFTKYDIEFMQGYANLVGAAIERNHYQTELAEAVRVKERLLAELQHRVNNNLMVVSSMLKIKSKLSTHPTVKQEIAEVVSSLSVLTDIYKQLHSSENVGRIDLGGYLSSLCNRILSFGSVHKHFGSVHKHRVRFEAECDPISVESRLAVPLGLVTNEFVTNSMKHAPDNIDLVISMKLHIENQALCLYLGDTGTGLGDALQHKNKEGSGTGLKLIEGLLSQIKGQWQWTTDSGTRIAIRVPLSANLVHGAAH